MSAVSTLFPTLPSAMLLPLAGQPKLFLSESALLEISRFIDLRIIDNSLENLLCCFRNGSHTEASRGHFLRLVSLSKPIR